MSASESVGWGWTECSSSPRVASQVSASTASETRSVAWGPTRWTPNTSPKRASATTLTKPSVCPMMAALPRAANGKRPTFTSWPAATASASLRPTLATSGWQ